MTSLRCPRCHVFVRQFLVMTLGATARPSTRPAAAAPPQTRPAGDERPEVFPKRAGAGRIVYVVDAAVAAAPQWKEVADALETSVASLPPDCVFDIVRYQDGRAEAISAVGMLAATRENKARVRPFLTDGAELRGEGDVKPALELAFRLRPKLVYWVAGDLPVDRSIPGEVADLNRNAHARIHTTAVPGAGNDHAGHFLQEMASVARENGGTFTRLGAPPAETDQPAAAATTQPATRPAEAAAKAEVVFCDPGQATRIAYVCDASGSMIAKFAALKNALSTSVDALKPHQSFNVVFFQDNAAVAMSKEGLEVANADNKRRAYKFLDDVTTTSTSDPLPGLKAAFKNAPQLMYILTDGDFPDNAAVLAEIRSLNKDKKVKINTIAFVNNNDTDTAFIDLLKTIAQENGGRYRKVDAGALP